MLLTPAQLDEVKEILIVLEEQVAAIDEATKRLGEIIND